MRPGSSTRARCEGSGLLARESSGTGLIVCGRLRWIHGWLMPETRCPCLCRRALVALLRLCASHRDKRRRTYICALTNKCTPHARAHERKRDCSLCKCGHVQTLVKWVKLMRSAPTVCRGKRRPHARACYPRCSTSLLARPSTPGKTATLSSGGYGVSTHASQLA